MRQKLPVQSHLLVKHFRDVGKAGKFRVKTQKPAMPSPFCKRLEHRVRSAKHRPIWQYEMNRLFQVCARNFWKTNRNLLFLEREIIDSVARGILPTRNPSTAELAIAVKNQERFRRRRLNPYFVRHNSIW